MKHSLVIFILLLLNSNLYSQDKKESVYLLFDANSDERCEIEVEYSSDNDGKLDGYQTVKKYRKSNRVFNNNYCIVFNIGDEEFVTNIKKDYRDTCSIDKLNQLKLVNIEYMVEKYDKSNEFKHHVFEKIFFIEKISRHRIIITDVMWSDEIFVVD